MVYKIIFKKRFHYKFVTEIEGVNGNRDKT